MQWQPQPGPCAGRETKDTQLYTSLIVNVILGRFAARAKCSRHHGVNLASPCIFKGFVEKEKLRGGRSSTSTSPSTLRTNCSFDFASHRGEQGECWLHIALGLPVERWWSCTPPGSGKSGLARIREVRSDWIFSAVVLLHFALSTTLLDRGAVHLQDGG